VITLEEMVDRARFEFALRVVITAESRDLLHAKEAIYRADLPAHGCAHVVRFAKLDETVKRIVE